MYALISRYKRPSNEVDIYIGAHRDWLKKNYAAGNFLISGRQKSGIGGFILAAPIGRSQLDQILSEDPFQQNGVAEYDVIEVSPTMADERLNFVIEKT